LIIMSETPGTTPTTTTAVSAHLTLQVGDEKKEFDVVAATDANGFKVAKALAIALQQDAWAWAEERS
jgi:adenine/guanine phosphoribosyltransferase-like PRPP-binding protein